MSRSGARHSSNSPNFPHRGTVRDDIRPGLRTIGYKKRVVIAYLDQNHWSTLAWAMLDQNKIANKDELAAARRIIELAGDAGIVQPLSPAHFTEAYPLYGDRRYSLGLAMAMSGI